MSFDSVNSINFTAPPINYNGVNTQGAMFNTQPLFGNNSYDLLGGNTDIFNSSNTLQNSVLSDMNAMFLQYLMQMQANMRSNKSGTFQDFGNLKFQLGDINLNQSKGEQLADAVKFAVNGRSTGYCARYVSNALAKTGLRVERGDAYQLADSLSNSNKFKEISVKKSEFSSLPPGCVVVYPKGAAGYSPEFGHVEVTLGDGRAASDFINNNPRYSQRMKVFVPV